MIFDNGNLMSADDKRKLFDQFEMIGNRLGIEYGILVESITVCNGNDSKWESVERIYYLSMGLEFEGSRELRKALRLKVFT